jgi:hypothetical protein
VTRTVPIVFAVVADPVGAGFVESARAAAAKMLRVGFVGMQPREWPLYTNFLRRMAELGYQEGRNFTFDYIQTPNEAVLRQTCVR